MTLLVCYPSKVALAQAVGQTLTHKETSMFGKEYKPDGKLTVAYRPTVWRHDKGGREFFAQVTMSDNKILKVE